MAILTNRELVLLGGGIGAGTTIGALVGIFATKKRYMDLADKEVSEARALYSTKMEELIAHQRSLVAAEKPEPEELVRRLERVEYERAVSHYTSPTEQEPDDSLSADPEVLDILETQNVFEQPQSDVADDGWDYEGELERRTALRDNDHPYIIHKDEFFGNSTYDKTSLVYFEGDDVLIDEDSTVVDPRKDVVSEEDLTRFGYGSGDPNIIYIRNDSLKSDFEICRDVGHYAEKVLGLFIDAPELEHSGVRRRRRGFDDD